MPTLYMDPEDLNSGPHIFTVGAGATRSPEPPKPEVFI